MKQTALNSRLDEQENPVNDAAMGLDDFDPEQTSKTAQLDYPILMQRRHRRLRL